MVKRVPWNKGKKGCFSKETILKMRNAKPAKDIWIKDKKISRHLTNEGYKVLRFWETDI